jgi:FkbM family methyltransferase
LRPIAVSCGAVRTAVLWLRGELETSQHYNTAIVGIMTASGSRIGPESFVELAVDPADQRGRELNLCAGNLNPPTLRMWQLLLAERPWTHVLDVGANYGEMLVNAELPIGARVIAFEPSPRILPYLERNLAAANLSVEIIASACSDRVGSAALLINRGYSGTTRLANPGEAAVDEWEEVQVPTTTLASALDAIATRSMRVLVKVDVEGREVPVIRGLMPAVNELEAFAALVEIKHLEREHLEWLVAHFDVDIYDLRADTFERVAPATAERLAQLILDERFYHQDAVLRRKPDRQST